MSNHCHSSQAAATHRCRGVALEYICQDPACERRKAASQEGAQFSGYRANATGQSAGEHDRSALKDTPKARLELHDLKESLCFLEEELSSGCKALTKKARERNKRKGEVSEVQGVIQLSNEPLSV